MVEAWPTETQKTNKRTCFGKEKEWCEDRRDNRHKAMDTAFQRFQFAHHEERLCLVVAFLSLCVAEEMDEDRSVNESYHSHIIRVARYTPLANPTPRSYFNDNRLLRISLLSALRVSHQLHGLQDSSGLN